jgi:hypothetical protein
MYKRCFHLYLGYPLFLFAYNLYVSIRKYSNTRLFDYLLPFSRQVVYFCTLRLLMVEPFFLQS